MADQIPKDSLLEAARLQVGNLAVFSGAFFSTISYLSTAQAAPLAAALTKFTLQRIAALSTVVFLNLTPRIMKVVQTQYLLLKKVGKRAMFDPVDEATKNCMRERLCLQSELSNHTSQPFKTKNAWRKRSSQLITCCCVVTYWIKVTTTMLQRTYLSAGGAAPLLLQALLQRF